MEHDRGGGPKHAQNGYVGEEYDDDLDNESKEEFEGECGLEGEVDLCCIFLFVTHGIDWHGRQLGNCSGLGIYLTRK